MSYMSLQQFQIPFEKTSGLYRIYVTVAGPPLVKKLNGETLEFRLEDFIGHVMRTHHRVGVGVLVDGQHRMAAVMLRPQSEYEMRPFKDGHAVYCKGVRLVSDNPKRGPWVAAWDTQTENMHEQYDYNE